jgi:hypothetical protein
LHHVKDDPGHAHKGSQQMHPSILSSQEIFGHGHGRGYGQCIKQRYRRQRSIPKGQHGNGIGFDIQYGYNEILPNGSMEGQSQEGMFGLVFVVVKEAIVISLSLSH